MVKAAEEAEKAEAAKKEPDPVKRKAEEEPPKKVPKMDKADTKPGTSKDEDVQMDMGENENPAPAATGNKAFMASSHTQEIGKLDANSQDPNHWGMESVTFKRSFEHVINDNYDVGMYKSEADGAIYLQPWHEIPYQLHRASMIPDNGDWLRKHAYVARLKKLWFTITGIKPSETVIVGSNDNPRLRLKDPPAAKVQTRKCFRGKYIDDDMQVVSIDDDRIVARNNKDMTNPIPSNQYIQGDNSCVLPLAHYLFEGTNANLKPKKSWLQALYNDLVAPSRNVEDAQKLYWDFSDAADGNFCLNPLFNMEQEMTKTHTYETLVGEGLSIDTGFNAWLFVNKVVPPMNPQSVLGIRYMGFQRDPLWDTIAIPYFCDLAYVNVGTNSEGD